MAEFNFSHCVHSFQMPIFLPQQTILSCASQNILALLDIMDSVITSDPVIQ